MKIKGKLLRVFYKTDGYTVFSLLSKGYDELKNERGEIIVTTTEPIEWNEGTPLKIEGESFQSTYGKSFKAEMIELSTDNREESIKLLKALGIKGVGEKKAEKIVDFTGDDLCKYFQKNENAVFDIAENVKGVSLALAEDIQKSVMNTEIVKEYFEMLKPFGGTFMNALKLKEIAPDIFTFEELMRVNPYSFLKSSGLSFSQIDSICKARNFNPHEPSRVLSVCKRALMEVLTSGSTVCEYTTFENNIKAINTESAYDVEYSFDEIVKQIMKSEAFVFYEVNNKPYIQFNAYYNLEKSISFYIKRLKKSRLRVSADMIERIEKRMGVTYAPEQKKAFESFQGLSVITGGPGTGKTTIIKGLIDAYKQLKPNGIVALCAPTGRAAQQMAEKTGHNASTVHKLLNLRPYGELEEGMKSDPIEADLIICDEVSMIDEVLFCSLLKNVNKNAHLILVGDVDQLPSVGAGNVLYDLIKSETVPVFRLNSIFRQSDNSVIVENSNRINKQNKELITNDNFMIIRKDTSDEIAEVVKKINAPFINSSDPYKFQILCPTKKGPAGADNINNLISSQRNGEDNKASFTIGDKVVFLRNNYDIGYMNGDIGYVTEYNNTEMTIELNDKEVSLSRDIFEDVALAYCLTIHKSQGSEYETVCIVLPEYVPIMLQKKLIYTAITRAKRNVIIITQNDALEKSIENEAEPRMTGLTDTLKGIEKNILD